MTADIQTRFDAWMETASGKQAANDFIRLALYCKNRLGKKVGQRAIWEKLRWEYEYERNSDENYKLNDHFTRPMVLFVMDRVPELVGYFELRGEHDAAPQVETGCDCETGQPQQARIPGMSGKPTADQPASLDLFGNVGLPQGAGTL